MARVSKEETFVEAIAVQFGVREGIPIWAAAQSVVEIMRTMGYLQETEYSRMMTIIVQRSGQGTMRSDGAETIELARDPRLVTMQEFPNFRDVKVRATDPEETLPREL
jgi:hypothetical protein